MYAIPRPCNAELSAFRDPTAHACFCINSKHSTAARYCDLKYKDCPVLKRSSNSDIAGPILGRPQARENVLLMPVLAHFSVEEEDSRSPGDQALGPSDLSDSYHDALQIPLHCMRNSMVAIYPRLQSPGLPPSHVLRFRLSCHHAISNNDTKL